MNRNEKDCGSANKYMGKNLLQNPNQLLALPLSKDVKSPWNVNVMADFISNAVSLSIYDVHKRRHLSLPLIEKDG